MLCQQYLRVRCQEGLRAWGSHKIKQDYFFLFERQENIKVSILYLPETYQDPSVEVHLFGWAEWECKNSGNKTEEHYNPKQYDLESHE